jgi:Family of unknown function (DUF5755)
MAKKCIPGLFCIENMTLFFLMFLVLILFYMFINYNRIHRVHNSVIAPIPYRRPNVVVVEQPPLIQSLFGLATRNDVYSNPYYPPLKNDGYYFSSGSSDIRGVPMIQAPPPLVAPVNIETRGLNSTYEQVGILTKNEASNNEDNLILPLFGRRNMAGRDKWQYYAISNTGNINTKLPVKVNGKSATSDTGVDPVSSGDALFVEGYNNKFKATVYENNSFSYIPL